MLIVYVGAVAVLFLFIVMMLNIKIVELNISCFYNYNLMYIKDLYMIEYLNIHINLIELLYPFTTHTQCEYRSVRAPASYTWWHCRMQCTYQQNKTINNVIILILPFHLRPAKCIDTTR